MCLLVFSSDKLVEQAVGVSSVAQIFKDHSEAFFRDNEVLSTYLVGSWILSLYLQSLDNRRG